MQLIDLDDETLKKYYLAWMGFNSEWQKRIQSKLKERIVRDKSLRDPFALIMATVTEKAQEKSLSYIAESFVKAVRGAKWHLTISDLMTDEAINAFVHEIFEQLGNPPGLDKELMIMKMKESRALLAFSSYNLSLGELIAEMQKAQDIAEEIGVDFLKMLTRADLVIEYLKRRYQPEEFKRKSEEIFDIQINQLLGIAKSQIELMPFLAPPGMSQRQLEVWKTVMAREANKRAKKIRKIIQDLIDEEIAEIWHMPKKRGFWPTVLQTAKQLLLKNRIACPDDLQRAFEEFRGLERGIKFMIVDIIDFPVGACSALIVRPTRPLTTSEKQEMGVYVKAKLLCEMPRAVSFLKDKSITLIRGTTPVIVSRSSEGRQFKQPAWYVRHPRGIIGPLTFLTDWDENHQAFIMHLIPARQNVAMSEPVLSAVIGRIARGYLKGVGTIEI